MSFREGISLPFKSIKYFFSEKIYKVTIFHFLGLLFLILLFITHGIAFCIYLVVMVYLTPNDPYLPAVIANLAVVGSLFFTIILFFLLTPDVFRRISKSTQSVSSRNSLKVSSFCCEWKERNIYFLKHILLTLLEWGATFFITVIIALCAGFPPLALLLFALFQCMILPYFGMRVLIIRLNSFKKVFNFIRKEIVMFIGIVIGMDLFLFVPFLNIFSYYMSVLVFSRAYFKAMGYLEIRLESGIVRLMPSGVSFFSDSGELEESIKYREISKFSVPVIEENKKWKICYHHDGEEKEKEFMLNEGAGDSENFENSLNFFLEENKIVKK